jgi:transcriptional regulator with XRE-family HTH domain
MSNGKAKYPTDHQPEAVKFARERAGLTKTGLAQMLGVSLPLISQIESGKSNATPAMIRKLAEALNCPVVVLERKRYPGPQDEDDAEPEAA